MVLEVQTALIRVALAYACKRATKSMKQTSYKVNKVIMPLFQEFARLNYYKTYFVLPIVTARAA